MTMTREGIAAVIADIRRLRCDPELAHAMEDELHVEFIRHVAESGYGELSELAAEVVKTGEVEFPRWCA